MASELCVYGGAELEDASKYFVMHYSNRTPSRTFGPLGLDLLLRFCRGLVARSADLREGGLAVGTTPADEGHRANMSVAFGAFLILHHGWTAERVAERLGPADAELMFACSWSRSDKPEAKRNMSVMDCWSGVEVAVRLGWLDAACLASDNTTFALCRRWRAMLRTYDCSWLVPGSILVGADPLTTALDPNPATFRDVFPAEDAASTTVSPASTPSTASSGHSDTTATVETQAVGEALKLQLKAPIGAKKEFAAALGLPLNAEDGTALDFVTLLRSAGVRSIIRMNFDDERGMPAEGGYDPKTFTALGFTHFDLPCPDNNGMLPKPADVRTALRAQRPDEEGADRGGVFVHCKAGFGRSVVLACCLAIERLDIPGAALLGWARIVRLGSVNTPQQEMMLKSFRGRNDVRRYAGMRGAGEETDTSQATCGCVTQ